MKLIYRIFSLIISLTLMVVCIVGITNHLVLKTASSHIKTAEELDEAYDCIIVLGAGVFSHRPSAILQDRLITGIELYKSGVSGKILMSGDHGRREYDEVNIMKSYAVEAGVSSEDVFMDHAGFSTYETMYRARDVFCVHKALIITQRFHMDRALYIANALGIDADGVVCDRQTYMYAFRNNIREILARSKDYFYVCFNARPTYLGEAVPVSGNGDLTND